MCSPVDGCARAFADPPAAKPAPQPAATVNGEAIPLDRVDGLIRRRPVVSTPLTAGQVRNLRLAVLDGLVEDLLLEQFLRQHGPKVEPAEVDAHAAALTNALRRLNRTPADYLREIGLTEPQARQLWAALIGWGKYVDKLATDAELRKYHADHRPLFDGATVRAAHIVARVSPSAPSGERQAARDRLAKVRAELVGGRISFSDAARKYSADPTAETGGDLGVVGRRDPTVDEPVLAAAFALPAGDISQPVDSEFGVHLVRVCERTAGTPTPYEKVADQVREAYADELRGRLLAKLRSEAAIRVTVP
jgi:parvulin-like peptidyl-prolyl isomerase